MEVKISELENGNVEELRDTGYVPVADPANGVTRKLKVGEIGSGVGRKDSTSGEIFNSYDGEWKNIATGDNSHAEGWRTQATEHEAHAEGQQTIASGIASHAEGGRTTAADFYAHAEGCEAKALGYCSHAEGNHTQAIEGYSHAEGNYTIASGPYSHAEGSNTEASGMNSHAECNATKASGERSHAEGSGSKAVGFASHAECSSCTAQGNYSHAEGFDTEAEGEGSHSEGMTGTARGEGSHCEGLYTQANGDFSHTEGRWTIAEGESQHVGGEYNIADTTSLEIIGNGTNDNARSNARTLDKQGNETLAGDIIVQGNRNLREEIEGKANSTHTHEQSEINGLSSALNGKISSVAVDGTSIYGDGKRTPLHGIGRKGSAGGAEIFNDDGYFTNEASGSKSHAEGMETKATGHYSHSEGQNTEANEHCSHAEGLGTIANGGCQHVGGTYNIADTTSLEIIGNGTNDNARSNARTLDQQGNETLAGDIIVKGNRNLREEIEGKANATHTHSASDITDVELLGQDYINHNLDVAVNGKQILAMREIAASGLFAGYASFIVASNDSTNSVFKVALNIRLNSTTFDNNSKAYVSEGEPTSGNFTFEYLEKNSVKYLALVQKRTNSSSGRTTRLRLESTISGWIFENFGSYTSYTNLSTLAANKWYKPTWTAL